ncbi:MAG: zinc-binding dehydrogenase [Bacteroidota bacterium]
MQRQAYQLKAGNLNNLQLVQQELADPAPHEVQIDIRAIGLNFADIFAMWGLYSATPEGVFIPGLEYAGVIRAVGSAVEGHRVGDAVMGVTRFGAYATALNIDQRYALPLPAGWSFAEGAAYLVQVLTAYYALVRLGDLREGKTVLIHSAAGGVGLLANRIAKRYAAYTIGTVGHASKVDFCRQEGYDAVIVRSPNFAEDLRQALGDRELALVMECIGGKVLEVGFEQLAPQGRMVVYGSARYARRTDKPNYLRLLWQFLRRPKIDPQGLIQSNKGLLGFNLIWLYEKAELMAEILTEVAALGLEKPFVGHTFTFEQLPEAIRLFQSGTTMGKVVIDGFESHATSERKKST